MFGLIFDLYGVEILKNNLLDVERLSYDVCLKLRGNSIPRSIDLSS